MALPAPLGPSGGGAVRVHFAALALAVLVGAAACSSSAPGGEATASSSEPIIGGTASGTDEDSVVLLIHTDLKSVAEECTGTLLAPNLVLTARHCVSESTDGAFACDTDGKLVQGSTGGELQDDFDPSQIYVFVGEKRPNLSIASTFRDAPRGQKAFHDDAKTVCSHDIALLLLDRSIPNASISPVRLDGGIHLGETFTAVGWGVTQTSATPNVRQARSGIAVTHVGPFAGSDVEDPVPGNDFSVGEAICQGDSGGPAISDKSAAVIGVVSRGGNGKDPTAADPAAGCEGSGTINEYTTTSAFKDLIVSAYQAAGQDPWAEGGQDPRLAKIGAACTQNAECRSNQCQGGSCIQACATSACPDGYECKDTSGTKLCAASTGGGGGGGGGCAVSPRRARLDGVVDAGAFGAAGAVPPGLALVLALGLSATLRSRSRPRRDRSRSS